MTEPPNRVSRVLIDEGDRNLGNFGDLIQFLVVDCNSNAIGFLRNTYEGGRPPRRGVLDEAGGKVRVQDGIWLLREGRVQSVLGAIRLVEFPPGP